MVKKAQPYPARLDIDYPVKLDRLTTFFRIFWAIPILIILTLISTAFASGEARGAGYDASTVQINGITSAGIAGGLFAATVLMIVFRQRYPRWWFDFALELNRFSTRVSAYLMLLTDRYPSTEEGQAVHLDLDYPDVKKDLNRWLPLVKWLLVIPHYIALLILAIGAVFAVVIAWFAILFTGKYPRALFDYVVGVNRWSLRVNAYAFLLVTDIYPPFSLK